MDNVNVIRTGFFAPDFSLPDSEGHMVSLKENLANSFVCLCFFPDGDNDKINGILKDLNSDMPKTAAGLLVNILAVSPEKVFRLKALKDKLKINFPLLSDLKLKAAKQYYVVDSNSLKRNVHFSVFIIDDAGIVRHRFSEVIGVSKFAMENLKIEIAKLL